jgi:DNA anti-recombination protein RmuC
MNDQQLEKKVARDVAKVKQDLRDLEDDGAAQIAKIVDGVNQSAETVSTRVLSGVSQLGERFEKLRDDAAETVVSASTTLKNGVGHGLSQYNAEATKVAGKVPGDLGKKAAMYPWVAMTITLIIGFLAASLLKPTRKAGLG